MHTPLLRQWFFYCATRTLRLEYGIIEQRQFTVTKSNKGGTF